MVAPFLPVQSGERWSPAQRCALVSWQSRSVLCDHNVDNGGLDVYLPLYYRAQWWGRSSPRSCWCMASWVPQQESRASYPQAVQAMPAELSLHSIPTSEGFAWATAYRLLLASRVSDCCGILIERLSGGKLAAWRSVTWSALSRPFSMGCGSCFKKQQYKHHPPARPRFESGLGPTSGPVPTGRVHTQDPNPYPQTRAGTSGYPRQEPILA